MRKFIVTYSYPSIYKGSYEVVVEDGTFASTNASEKVKKYLEEKYGKVTDSYCVVTEIYGKLKKIK